MELAAVIRSLIAPQRVIVIARREGDALLHAEFNPHARAVDTDIVVATRSYSPSAGTEVSGCSMKVDQSEPPVPKSVRDELVA